MIDNTPAHATTILEHTREELGRADAKAGILLAVNGVGAGAVLNKLTASGNPAPTNALLAILWWGAVLAVAVSSGFLIAAIKPRVTRGRRASGTRITYFADVSDLSGPGELSRVLRQRQDDWLDALADQIWHVSRLCQVKYGYLSRGLWLMTSGWAAFIAVTAIGSAISH
jgi:hypothetical protein